MGLVKAMDQGVAWVNDTDFTKKDGGGILDRLATPKALSRNTSLC